MKKFCLRPTLLIAFFLLIAYVAAEFIIRGNALNQITFGIGGYLFWGGIALLLWCWILLPVFHLVTFPQWVDPDTFTDPRAEYRYLKKMGKYYVKTYGRKCPEKLSGLISDLKRNLHDPDLSSEARLNELRRLVPETHKRLGEMSDRIISDYMKKTAILVCISQRGWLDSLAMLVMQIRMIVDLSRSLGYRPSWIFILYCLGWVLVNSIAFALFDGTDVLEDAMRDLLPLVIGESLGKSLPLGFGKIVGIAAQGAASMAIIYATGKIIQRKLTGFGARLSGKERVRYRIEGYKKAAEMIKI